MLTTQNIKTSTCVGSALLLIIFSSAIGYRLGYSKREQYALVNKRATFAVTLSTIEYLRSGDFDSAVKAAENHCYANALSLLQTKRVAANDSTMSALIPNLIQYRSRWRTNAAEWTPAEHQLERILGRDF